MRTQHPNFPFGVSTPEQRAARQEGRVRVVPAAERLAERLAQTIPGGRSDSEWIDLVARITGFGTWGEFTQLATSERPIPDKRFRRIRQCHYDWSLACCDLLAEVTTAPKADIKQAWAEWAIEEQEFYGPLTWEGYMIGCAARLQFQDANAFFDAAWPRINSLLQKGDLESVDIAWSLHSCSDLGAERKAVLPSAESLLATCERSPQPCAIGWLAARLASLVQEGGRSNAVAFACAKLILSRFAREESSALERPYQSILEALDSGHAGPRLSAAWAHVVIGSALSRVDCPHSMTAEEEMHFSPPGVDQWGEAVRHFAAADALLSGLLIEDENPAFGPISNGQWVDFALLARILNNIPAVKLEPYLDAVDPYVRALDSSVALEPLNWSDRWRAVIEVLPDIRPNERRIYLMDAATSYWTHRTRPPAYCH